MVMNVLSVCVIVLILALHHADPSTEVPAWLYNLLFKQSKVGLTERDQIQEIPEIEISQNEMANARKWQNVARLVNKALFWVFLSGFILMLVVCITLWFQE